MGASPQEEIGPLFTLLQQTLPRNQREISEGVPLRNVVK
jgi:hypothetical protein